jgi:hypothetical protein
MWRLAHPKRLSRYIAWWSDRVHTKMSFSAAIEGNNSERCYLEGGKTLLSFWTSLSNYCQAVSNDEDKSWFSDLENHSGKKFSTESKPFLNSVYNSEALSTVQEKSYEEFIKSMGEYIRDGLSEKAYYETIEQAETAWQDIEKLIESLQNILAILKHSKQQVSFFDPVYTLAVLKDVENCLQTILRNGASKARIDIA